VFDKKQLENILMLVNQDENIGFRL